VSIRWAVPADAAAIAEVHVRSWKAAYPGMIPQSYLDALKPETRFRTWETILASPETPGTGTLLLVDEDEERVEGFASIGPNRDPDIEMEGVGEVMALYLDPGSWGRGAGRTLLAAAVDEIASAGNSLATLWVLDTNEPARRFYEHLGWRADGTSKLHDWTAFVATDVRYRLELS